VKTPIRNLVAPVMLALASTLFGGNALAEDGHNDDHKPATRADAAIDEHAEHLVRAGP
jgi:hypothetical protein